jgi:hypothetical protein
MTAEPGCDEHSVMTTMLENVSATRSDRSELFATRRGSSGTTELRITSSPKGRREPYDRDATE